MIEDGSVERVGLGVGVCGRIGKSVGEILGRSHRSGAELSGTETEASNCKGRGQELVGTLVPPIVCRADKLILK